MKKLVSNLMVFLLIAAVSTTVISSCKGTATDEEIKTAIDAKVASTAEMAGMMASVTDGVVTITGETRDDACRAMCESTIKGMKGVKSVVNNCTVAPATPVAAPVDITADDPLTKGVADAVKDFNGVKADVKDGVITLTGEIKKADLEKLMPTLHSLKPKNIDNQLTIK